MVSSLGSPGPRYDSVFERTPDSKNQVEVIIVKNNGRTKNLQLADQSRMEDKRDKASLKTVLARLKICFCAIKDHENSNICEGLDTG